MRPAHPAAALALAVAVNSASVAVQGRTGLLTRAFGSAGLPVHAAAIVPAWAWFVRSVSRVPRTGPVPPALVAVGLLTEAVGLALVVAGFRRLGPAAAVNGDVFGRVERRPARPLWGAVRDPIYTGYSTWLAGWAVRTGRPQLLPLAALMFALLTLEGRIEDWAADASARGRSAPM